MKILEPSLVILVMKLTQGLDIDALKIVADGVNFSRDAKILFSNRCHYQRLNSLNQTLCMFYPTVKLLSPIQRISSGA